jgi:hypothetical protein
LNPSVTESNVLGWLRQNWEKGSDHDFEDKLITQGYSNEQASQLREKWMNEGLLAYDPDGWLVWVKGGAAS